ncbi:MarR family transcriptional regulator [Roseomonas terrae]|uniref:MarR family transcriptional regulator n=1 Tax=Neoroseomonas terrae TaxID=424799 RepID=A0ABS5EK18_9PROT|nr:MarR family transcriptional regulator [Neoroseomonas terrae]MBR0651375.1 MarR family transcriptional regulator [Neoroseomonas terrae]
MNQVHESLLQAVREGMDLNVRQIVVLLELAAAKGPLSVRGLAHHLQVSKPAITRAIDRLETLGLAIRPVNPADQRDRLLQPTEKGREQARQLSNAAAPLARAA